MDKNNLILSEASFSDLEEMNSVYEEIKKYFSFDNDNEYKTPKQCIVEGDLPPGIKDKDKYNIFTIRYKDELIGYYDTFEGYPSNNILYISLLFICEKYRKSGFGKYILESIFDYCKKRNLDEIRIGVSLKNWSAINFWFKSGFNEITYVRAKGNCSENNNGLMELSNKHF
jgi:L-amino acid N-acyltransferase YncA